MLNWADRFNIFCFLDKHHYNNKSQTFDCILAAGSLQRINFEEAGSFMRFKDAFDPNPCWLFGHMGYNLKSEFFPSVHEKEDITGFGKGLFFEPEFIILIKNNIVQIQSYKKVCIEVFEEINKTTEIVKGFENPIINPRINKEAYLDTIEKLKWHIQRGDCYEINFCQEFLADNAHIEPLLVYQKLSQLSPNPFAALYKLDDKYCICESPERYLKKTGQQIISQPIKGTAPRNKKDKHSDEKNRESLLNSIKEKAENVMVVDLVRNDLSRVCIEGSVMVEELFEIYTFPQVYQMISTVKGVLPVNITFAEIIKATFPMGSMTGAPKHKVLQLIDEYECSDRGLFSGSIGYITPYQDFDFNVVIRSIFYNRSKSHVSFWAGSAITFYSNAEEEYKECMLKAEAIIQVLTD
ncbi:MAG: anthranilate synthase component I family protein [Ferruginibacter sp.]